MKILEITGSPRPEKSSRTALAADAFVAGMKGEGTAALFSTGVGMPGAVLRSGGWIPDRARVRTVRGAFDGEDQNSRRGVRRDGQTEERDRGTTVGTVAAGRFISGDT